MEIDSGLDAYTEVMKGLQVDFVSDISKDHAYANDLKKEAAFPKERVVRLGREISALNSLLPVNPSSSIFVRIDEQNLMLWKALIIGPEETPYSAGCFIFDIYFPISYPTNSPKVFINFLFFF